jgi:polyferredoxin
MPLNLTLKSFNTGKLRLPIAVFLFVGLLLAMVQVKMTKNPLLLLERFFEGWGWIEVMAVSVYGAFVAYKMQDPVNVPKWRKLTWTLFAVVFFSQLIIGLLGANKFLMTGKLHLPIPMMILAGPLYREQISVMTILFLSTIFLTGPAWCSHFCYFGAFDNLAATGKTKRKPLRFKAAIKSTVLLLVIGAVIVLRLFNVPIITATILAASFGIVGILVMILISRRNKKMIHCALYCPIGTLVNVMKPVNPFRLYIDDNCNLCMKCTSLCKYDALNITDVKNKKPNYSCTLCGDCLSACRDNSIKYRFLRLKPQHARFLYLFLTISIHSVFLALARI